jgi:hypothetical protein
MDSVIEILVVRALAPDAQWQLTEALSALERALTLAERKGMCAPLWTRARRWPRC